MLVLQDVSWKEWALVCLESLSGGISSLLALIITSSFATLYRSVSLAFFIPSSSVGQFSCWSMVSSDEVFWFYRVALSWWNNARRTHWYFPIKYRNTKPFSLYITSVVYEFKNSLKKYNLNAILIGPLSFISSTMRRERPVLITLAFASHIVWGFSCKLLSKPYISIPTLCTSVRSASSK